MPYRYVKPAAIDMLNQQQPNNIMESTTEPLRNWQGMEQLNTCDWYCNPQ